jgi:nucleotide-binding universal stress UspA family protein
MFAAVVVPLDGSELAATAIPAAAAIARAGHAGLRLVRVARHEDELAAARRQLTVTARTVTTGPSPDVQVLLHHDPADALLAVAADPTQVLCLASHDVPPPAAHALHAIGSTVIARAAHPLIIVGPRAAPTDPATEVVVAVDGVHAPQPVLATATAWAQQMNAPLRIVTVYQPVPADVRRPSHFTRRHGPPGDPDEYLNVLAGAVESGEPTTVSTAAIADPVSVPGGLADHLASRPARLLVVGANHRGLHPASATLRDLLRAVAVPVLVVKGTHR